MKNYIIEVNFPNIITHNKYYKRVITYKIISYKIFQNELRIAQNIIIVLLILKNIMSSRL